MPLVLLLRKPKGKMRGFCHNLATDETKAPDVHGAKRSYTSHQKFDLLVNVAIVLNVLMLAC